MQSLDANQKRTGPALSQIAATFAPFALLLSAALLAPETQTSVVLFRTKYTVWVSIIFATPAYTLYVLGIEPKGSPVYQYWRLLWTFSFLGYAMHFYYAFFVMYRSNISAVLDQQTAKVGISNFIFTIWWALDVALLWFTRKQDGWVRLQRICFQVFSFIVFITAFVFLRPGAPFYFGITMLLTVLLAALIRLLTPPLPTPINDH
jgi:hypothetical protein